MADFDEIKKAMRNATRPTNEAIRRLVNEWGPEVILKCECNTWPSHLMYGQKGYGRCGACNTDCVLIFKSWSTPENE